MGAPQRQRRSVERYNISGIEAGDVFQVACQRLGNNTSLDDARERYGLGGLAPICGENRLLPISWAEALR